MSTDPRTVQAYDDNAEAYDAHVSNPSDSPLHEYYEKPAMRAELPPLESLSILSIGCGSGSEEAWLKAHGAKTVVGVDISSELIGIARSNYPDIRFEVMDMENLQLSPESFDLVYSSLSLHYASDWQRVLDGIRKVLKPNGIFVFSCNHPLETAMEGFRTATGHGMHIGRSIDNTSGERQIFGDYLSAENAGIRPRTSTVADNHEVYSYHRTFSKMANDIIESGFHVIKVIEPTPLYGMKKDNPEHFKQVEKTPKFIIWKLQK